MIVTEVYNKQFNLIGGPASRTCKPLSSSSAAAAMSVEAVVAWYQEYREVERLEDSICKQIGSICLRLMNTNKDLSEEEAARLKEERRELQKKVGRIYLDMPPRPDFSGMTEAERAATAERLRRDEMGDPAMGSFARIVDFDPKQDGRYLNRFHQLDLTQFDLDEESPIGPMSLVDCPYKKESDFPGLCKGVNFLTIKIASLDVSFPICVYGTVIVRDSIDDRCVYHFRRDSDNCQLINSEAESLILTGPKRGLAFDNGIYVEIDLKIKDELVQDRELSKGLISIRNSFGRPVVDGYMFETRSLASRLSTVDVNYTVVYRALEGTIAVEVLQGGFHGKITASIACKQFEFVLYDSKEADATTVDDCGVLELMRPVVCVHVEDLLLISAQTSYGMSELAFNPRINDRAEGQLVVGGTKLRVKLCWSVMFP